MARVDHIDGRTFHGRKGAVQNAFTYSVDYVLLDAEREESAPRLFSRNKGWLFSVNDKDHGGPPKDGKGASWVRDIIQRAGLDFEISRIELLAQPRVMGHVFNPVSFWLVRGEDEALRTVIAEVSNTYGDRHSYLCHHDDLSPITREDTLCARKIFHVSPFQPVDGDYTFRFDVTKERIGVWIDYKTGNGSLLATLTGDRKPLTNLSILRVMLRRPFGSRRVLGLIHWQALKLWWKGAVFRARPEPPSHEVSR